MTKNQLIHQNYSLALAYCSPIKQGSHDELCSFIDCVEHNIKSMKETKQYYIGAFLTSILAN